MASEQGWKRGTRAFSLTISAAVCMALAISTAQATAVVESGPNLVQSILNQINTYIQRSQDRVAQQSEGVHRVQEIQHMAQQLASVQSYVDRVMPMGLASAPLEERPLDFGVETMCPSDGGMADFSLAKLWQRIVPQPDGDIGEQQLQICQRIQMAKNAKHNEIVRVMRNLQMRSAEVASLSSGRAGVGSNEGKLETNTNDASRFLATATLDIQYSETAIRAYDNLIASLNSDQQFLARQGLNGKKSKLLGTVSQGVTLKSALQVLRSRDR